MDSRGLIRLCSFIGGWKATQNCWYGYNCKTQAHKASHAKEKNVRRPFFHMAPCVSC
jgi:hypothetical protein